MTKRWLKTPQVYPTSSLAVAFAAGALWFFAMPWGGRLFQWLGLGYNMVLLAFAIVDYILLTDSRKCRVTREELSILSINEPNPIWLRVVHRGGRKLKVTIKDEPPLEFEVKPDVLEFTIEPGEEKRLNYKAKPSERGDYRFGNINVRLSTVMGLLMRQETLAAEANVKVYPDVFQTQKHLLLARENRAVQMGLRRSRIYGQGQEFERLRDYVPDDSLRHIDWKATARRNVLTTREYDVDQSQTIMLLIDMGRTMASRTVDEDGETGISKADCAINASVLLAHVATESDDRVGLFCFARGPITYVPPGKGAPQAARLLDSLYALQPRIEESNYYENLLLLGQKQRKRSLVFVFTDLIDPDSSQRLISSMALLVRKHLVVCVALADYELPSIINAKPEQPADAYKQAVALGIIRERKRALAKLESLGVTTIDANPSDLSIATVNKYLQLKREGKL